MTKRLLAILLCLALCFALLPEALAEEPNATAINYVSVTLDWPLAGMLPDYTAEFPDSAHYYSDDYENTFYRNDIVWYEVSGSGSLSSMYPDSSTFQLGHVYRVIVYLTAETGYYFGAIQKAWVSHQPAETAMNGEQLRLSYTFAAVSQQGVPSVSITLDVPAAGEYPDYTAEFPAGAPYYSDAYEDEHYRNNIMWHAETYEGDYNLKPDIDVFYAGHQYRVIVHLTAREGYKFSSSTTATVNGRSAEAHMNSTLLTVEYVFPTVGEAISSASVTLDAPTVGRLPDYTAEFPDGAPYYSKPTGGGYRINDVVWWDLTDDTWMYPYDSLFRAGHVYQVRLYLSAKEGYYFTDGTTAMLNGQSAEASKDGLQLRVEVTFPVLEVEIPYVYLTLDVPVVGSSPDYTAEFLEGAHYYSAPYNTSQFRNDIRWWDCTADTGMDPDNDVFRAGHLYRVIIYLTAQENYYFTDSTTATVNWYAAEASLFSGQLKVEYTFLPLASGYAVTVTDKTGGSASSSLSAGTYSGTLSFTVSSTGDKALTVIAHVGSSYSVLPCTDSGGKHNFSLSLTGDTEIILVYKGDADLNAKVNMRDALAIKKHTAGTELLTGAALCASDADGNGKTNMRDSLAIKKDVAGTEKIKW